LQQHGGFARNHGEKACARQIAQHAAQRRADRQQQQLVRVQRQGVIQREKRRDQRRAERCHRAQRRDGGGRERRNRIQQGAEQRRRPDAGKQAEKRADAA